MIMIKVLHVVTDMNRGGLETMIMNYYRHIDRNEVQFDFLTHRSYDGDYGEEIKSLGGTIYHLPKLNPFSAKYRRALGIFFDDHPEYKIIHVHQDCMSSVVLKIAKKHKLPVRIAHSHSRSQDKNLKYPIKLFYRHFIAKYATKLFACSEEAGKWMFCGAEFEVFNNAIETEKFLFNEEKRAQVRSLLGIPEDVIVVGHVGRFSYPKNHNFLVDIFKCVSEKAKSKLLLVGDGVLRDSIENKVRSLGLEKDVIFTGVRDDVNDLLQAMDVFVFPSNYEGLPVTIVEAQASGLQCIISENVPIECKITDLVSQIRLSNGAETWAEYATEASRCPRENEYESIKESGYDIEENAKKLLDYYVNEYRSNE